MTDSTNLDLVRSIYADWERGDWSRADWADPDIEFVIADGPDPRNWKSVDAMGAGWNEFLTAWAEYRVQPVEYRDLGDNHVLVSVRVAGRGKSSGVDLALTAGQGATLFHIEKGKVTRLVIYFDRSHAFADLGLNPQGES